MKKNLVFWMLLFLTPLLLAQNASNASIDSTASGVASQVNQARQGFFEQIGVVLGITPANLFIFIAGILLIIFYFQFDTWTKYIKFTILLIGIYLILASLGLIRLILNFLFK